MPSVKASRDVILQAADLDAVGRFYEGVLGLELFERSPGILGFEAGGFRLFVEPGPSPVPVFEFLVYNVQATKRRLVSEGCTIVDENSAVPRCYLKDPFGLTFNLAQRGGETELLPLTPTEADEVR